MQPASAARPKPGKCRGRNERKMTLQEAIQFAINLFKNGFSPAEVFHALIGEASNPRAATVAAMEILDDL